MLIDLDKFQLLYYLEGCARGSHLRQGCWRDMIDLYPKMEQDMRDFLYTYAKRDIAPIFASPSDGVGRPVGADDFDMFLDCFDHNNHYMVTAEKDGQAETAETFLYGGRYYTGSRSYFDEEYITKIEPILNTSDYTR